MKIQLLILSVVVGCSSIASAAEAVSSKVGSALVKKQSNMKGLVAANVKGPSKSTGSSYRIVVTGSGSISGCNIGSCTITNSSGCESCGAGSSQTAVNGTYTGTTASGADCVVEVTNCANPN